MTIQICLERGQDGPWMGHWPRLPGCCWIRPTHAACLAAAMNEILAWVAFLDEQPAPDSGLPRPAGDDTAQAAEERTGQAGVVGESGAAMALFDIDGHPPGLNTLWPVVMTTAAAITALAGTVEPGNWNSRPHPNRRSLDDVFRHLGNCLWWYCSRLDDTLPEWPDGGLTPLERFNNFLPLARQYYAEWPADRIQQVTVPHRYPSADPAEPWQYGKSLRRQAEHLREHLYYLQRDIDSYRHQG
jgi:predicted RNase H-like HicB family nuclease